MLGAEEHPRFPLRIGPVLQERAGGRGDPRPACCTPPVDHRTDVVDQPVLLDSIFGSLDDLELLLCRLAPQCCRHHGEVGRHAASFGDLVGHPLVVEAPVVARHLMRAVQDEIFDAVLIQGAPPSSSPAGRDRTLSRASSRQTGAELVRQRADCISESFLVGAMGEQRP